MAAPTDDDFDFAEMLKEFGHGAVNRQASKLLREIVKNCEATGKKGKMVITFAVGSAGGIAQLAADIKITRPEPALPGGAYYVTEDGGLVEEDPRQQKFPTRVIPMTPIKRDPDNGGAS